MEPFGHGVGRNLFWKYSLLFLLSCIIQIQLTGGTSGPVSFFGSSHVSVRLQEARSSSDIYFRLRTRRADSMLFLAAGKTDYCLLVLDAGRLKVHINLGAGETEIASEAPFVLNDMKWHSVNLTRRGSQISLQVDNHITKGNLPSRFHELNIHFGIWLGGLAGFNEIFLGNLPSFRGCMSHITYNQEDLLSRAKTHHGQIQGVTWNCSDEFDASTQESFSLTSTSSYVISRVAISRQGTVVKMSLRPYSQDGLIFYVSGVSSRPDYLALELHQGKVRFIAEMGSGPLHVESATNITDNQWHPVLLQVSPYSLSLMVDNQSWISEPGGRGGSRHLDVSELVYLGLEESRRVKVRSQGLIDRSFRGCVKDLMIDEKPYGLPEVDVTSNITTGCGLVDCLAKNLSCPSGMSTNNNNLNGTSSQLEVITISRDLIRIVTQTDMGELEIMRVTPVQVAEGDSVIITPRHLAITLDLSKFGIRESGVLFRINKSPQQGRIEVTSRSAGGSSGGGGRSTETFSLLDVGAGRVRYWHNGAESSRDSIELNLRLLETSGFLLPAYLQDERVVSLPIEITAVNDPPEIRLVPGGVLRLAERTKIRLMPEVITSLDPDTPPQDLHFSLISLGTPAEKKGFLELSSETGKPIRNFTQADLEASRVWYVDQGLSSSKMALKVTDGSSVSQTAVLRIETFPLRIAPEVNTGLEVANVMGTASGISSTNLSFTSNAAEQGLVVEYHIISPCKAGVIQLRRTNGQWTPTDHFTQMDLQAAKLRYLLQRPSELATEDEFTFHVSLSETKVPSEFRFRLRIVSLRLEQVGTNTLYLNGTTQGALSLNYRTFPLAISDQSINYILVQPPRFGHLTFAPSQPSSAPINNFSQAQLVAGKVIYSFKLTPFSPFSDFFLFNVSTSHLDLTLTSGPFRCDVHHSTKKKPAGVVLKPLIVTEGGRESLSSKILRIRVAGESEQQSLYYNISSGPNYGVLEKERESLRLSSLSTSSSSFQSVSSFSSVDLDRGRLSYRHDGSETPRDKLEMVAWNSESNFMFAFQMDIIIKGVNNHPPRRSPSASLSVNVIVGGRRSLSPEILDYIDEDWDADRGALKYTTKGNPSGGTGGRDGIGNIYDQSKSPSRPIFQWTQADIDAGKLVFKHEGTETQGSLHFWVTDGKFIVNGTLGISAGAPWVRVLNSSSLVAKKGSIAKLTDESIRIDTNLDVDSSTIIIRILEGHPQHGFIKVNGSLVSNFTLGEMSGGLVAYENGAVTDVGRDGFGYEAIVEGKVASELNHFDISIYPEAYWTPLTVGANGSVTVNENSSAVISQTSLHIINPHIPPTDIVYTLVRPPKHGYLAIDPSNSHEETDDYVTMWDQTVINDGRLRYVQSESNRTHDSMHFHVTNGVQTLKNLRLDFIVVPATLILASTTLTLNEGSLSILNLTHLHSAQSYFSDKLLEVKVMEGPRHGTIGLVSRPEIPIQTFPYKSLQDGKIVYTHDGSETTEDQFTVLAVGQIFEDSLVTTPTRKLSQPHVIHVKIISTNDQVPFIANNTGTWVWLGGSAPITNVELAAMDGDSDESQLIFYIVGSRGGFPALKDQPDAPLQNFTQAQINHSQIVFTHKGNDMKPGSFEFEVSDGLNEAEKQMFKVLVRKPELTIYEGRVPLPVFPFTQAPIKPENLLVRSNDEREVHFQVTSSPGLGQIVLDLGEGKFAPVSVFSQWNVSNGKVYYEHLKSGRGQRSVDWIRLTASSRYSDPLMNVSVEVDISVSGAALGGLQRYVTIQPLAVKEGGQVSITSKNINFSAVSEFISMQHRGNMWRGGLPTLRLLVSEVPKHGWLIESDEHRLRPGAEILPSLLSSQSYLKYLHDDSETTGDQVGLSLWLFTTSSQSNGSSLDDTYHLNTNNNNKNINNNNDHESSTWLLNITLPIQITPVNDQPFSVVSPKAPISPVVQEHWRKVSRNDLLTSDPDTPPAHIVYEVTKVSHGRFILLSPTENSIVQPSSFSLVSSIANSNGPNGISLSEIDLLKELPSADRFTQADIDVGKVIFYHNGPVLPVMISLKVSDGEHGPGTVGLNIPVQQLTLQALQSQATPIRIQQGNNMMSLSLLNLPSQTNGHPAKLHYNLTRYPLHGKILFKDRTSTTPVFSHHDLLRGELSYVQTDMSVTNDSFEVWASFNEPELRRVTTTWLVNVVSIPLLRRIKEVRSFIKGFAVGGLVAPDEAEFSVSSSIRTTLNLALLDASPLATLTGANPLYEILFPPKYGHLYKIPPPHMKNAQGRYKRGLAGRRASRFSHEDIRRGTIIYVPEIMSNEIVPSRISPQADEFIFKVLAPGVQPAIGVAKFHMHNGFYDTDKGPTEIISDGSTDPATKRSRDGSGNSMRDLTYLVTPQLTKDSLIMIGLIIAGVMTLSLFLVVGIRCTCSKKRSGGRRGPPRRNSPNNGGLNNGDPNNKTNGIGIIDAYAPSNTMIDTCCASDSDAGLRPLMMSTLSPRASRNKVSMSRTGTTGSESGGSWTSSVIRNEIPTPSVPQCRVTPLCNSNSSDSGGTSLLTCPLLPPTPICDTFSVLPEELDPPPEPYGFSYGNLPPPLEIADLHEEETAFHEFSTNSLHHHQHHLNSNSSTMTRGTMTLPHSNSHHSGTNSQGTNTPTHPLNNGHGHANNPGGGTLKRQPGKNQYWV